MVETFRENHQQNIVVALCYDEANYRIIRSSVDLALFEGEYRTLAAAIYKYIDDYSKPPADHVHDILIDLARQHPDSTETYSFLAEGIEGLKGNLNYDYVLDSLTEFVRQQHLKQGIMSAAQLVQTGGDDVNQRVENVLSEALAERIDIFDPGTFLIDTERGLKFLDETEDSFPTGIEELDRRDLGPIRKGLHLFVAPPKRGKSWWLIHLGRRSVMAGHKVCHVTLEMSESLTAQRYYQAFHSISKRNDPLYRREIVEAPGTTDFEDLDEVPVQAAMSFDDPDIREKIAYRSDHYKMRNIVIKEFPTGSLTVPDLEGYLNSLINVRFKPDLLIIDYVDLMHLSSNNYRHDLGKLYKDVRGLAVKYNIAIATASQSNRSGIRKTDESTIAEDFSKLATADTVIMYNQTEMERRFGLARLLVTNARSDETGIALLISQSYATGVFVRKATYLTRHYDDVIDRIKLEEDL